MIGAVLGVLTVVMVGPAVFAAAVGSDREVRIATVAMLGSFVSHRCALEYLP